MSLRPARARLPRLAEPANTAVFLASDASGAMTGAVVNLSCGAIVDQGEFHGASSLTPRAVELKEGLAVAEPGGELRERGGRSQLPHRPSQFVEGARGKLAQLPL